MNSEKYIGLDVHQATIVVAVTDSSGSDPPAEKGRGESFLLDILFHRMSVKANRCVKPLVTNCSFSRSLAENPSFLLSK
jgi:hypothetical protein